MKILLVDKDDISTISRVEFLRNQTRHDIEFVSTFDAFKAQFAKGRYRIVVLDFAFESGKKALEYIDKIDPDQRVITISDSEEYSEPDGCLSCVERFRRRRLKKPFPLTELVDLICNFDLTGCAYYHE
jgi:DNA-binding NtrC family response regulator